MFALNVVLITATELWALRYPDVHELFVLERAAGGPSGRATWTTPARRGSVRVRSGDLATRPGGGRGQRADGRGSGLARARAPASCSTSTPDLRVTITRPLDRPPAHQLTLADLGRRRRPRSAEHPA